MELDAVAFTKEQANGIWFKITDVTPKRGRQITAGAGTTSSSHTGDLAVTFHRCFQYNNELHIDQRAMASPASKSVIAILRIGQDEIRDIIQYLVHTSESRGFRYLIPTVHDPTFVVDELVKCNAWKGVSSKLMLPMFALLGVKDEVHDAKQPGMQRHTTLVQLAQSGLAESQTGLAQETTWQLTEDAKSLITRTRLLRKAEIQNVYNIVMDKESSEMSRWELIKRLEGRGWMWKKAPASAAKQQLLAPFGFDELQALKLKLEDAGLMERDKKKHQIVIQSIQCWCPDVVALLFITIYGFCFSAEPQLYIATHHSYRATFIY